MHADGGFNLPGYLRRSKLGPALYAQKALDGRKRHEGTDPNEARRAERARQRLDASKSVTFKACTDAYMA